MKAKHGTKALNTIPTPHTLHPKIKTTKIQWSIYVNENSDLIKTWPTAISSFVLIVLRKLKIESKLVSESTVRYFSLGSLDILSVERRIRDQKVAGSNPGRSGGRIFFSRV